jgi:hypothetical protein
MGDKFKFVIESRHFADRGDQKNVRLRFLYTDELITQHSC